MNEKVYKYRQKHKRCKYCKHLQLIIRKDTGGSYYHCDAKYHIISDCLPNMISVPRWFCGCYEVKEDDSRE